MAYKHGKEAPSFVILDEGALNKFFNKADRYNSAKIFFEGEGLVQETKMKHPKLRWKGVPVILATNVLPEVMMEPIKKNNEEEWEFQMRRNDHVALVTRCKLANLTTSHKNGDLFPYSE